MKLASKKSVLVLAALSAVLAAASYGAYWWQTGRFLQTTDDAYVGGDISAISAKSPAISSSWRCRTIWR